MSARAQWLADRLGATVIGSDRPGDDGVRLPEPPGPVVGDPGWTGPVGHDRRDVSVVEFEIDAVEVMVRPELVAGAIAELLVTLHQVSTEGCPFESSVDSLVALASRRVAAGDLSSGDFSPPYRHLSPTRALEILVDMATALPPGPPPVVVHGAFGTHQVRFSNGRVSSLRDLGRLGVGDPYLDLAPAARDLATLLGGGSVGPFFAACGLEHPDPRRIDFFALLDELIRHPRPVEAG